MSSSLRNAAPSVRGAIRNTRVSAPRGASRPSSTYSNLPPGNHEAGPQKNPSGAFPWTLAAAAMAIPTGVYLSTMGRDRPSEVALDPTIDRLKALKHRDLNSLPDRGAQIAEDTKANLIHTGKALTGNTEHPHFTQERLNNERLRSRVDERTGESTESKGWSLFDSLRGKTKTPEHLERRASETMGAAENKAGEALRTAENKGGEALRTAEEKSKSYLDDLSNRTEQSMEFAKDKAQRAEKSFYDAFTKPADLPEDVQRDIERQRLERERHAVRRTNPDTHTSHTAGNAHQSHTNIDRTDYNKPAAHKSTYGTPGRHPRNFEESIEGPPEDSPNKAPTVPSSDEDMITKAHHRRLYSKDAANEYPQKGRKGEGVLDTSRLTKPVNSWTRPMKGFGGNMETPPNRE